MVVGISISVGLGVLALDDFKLARTFFLIAAADAMGGTIMWGANTTVPPWIRTLSVFALGGTVAVVAVQSGRYVDRKKEAKESARAGTTGSQQQEEHKKPEIQQQSGGANSPNIVGNGNEVLIYPPASKPSGKSETTQGFHEVQPEVVAISLGSDSAEIKMSDLREKKVAAPFYMYGVAPFRLSIGKHNELLFSFVSWSNGVKIEVDNNQVKIGDPLVDRNFSPNAFEIVNGAGEPIFQLIRNPSSITVNGIFPTPTISSQTGLPLVLWISPETGILSSSTKPAAFKLKPIFKYPSWKYTGQYSD